MKYGDFTHFRPFLDHFGPPMAQIFGNLEFESAEYITYELSGVVNGGIATKISILGLLGYEIWWFYPFGAILGAFLDYFRPPRVKILGDL